MTVIVASVVNPTDLQSATSLPLDRATEAIEVHLEEDEPPHQLPKDMLRVQIDADHAVPPTLQEMMQAIADLGLLLVEVIHHGVTNDQDPLLQGRADIQDHQCVLGLLPGSGESRLVIADRALLHRGRVELSLLETATINARSVYPKHFLYYRATLDDTVQSQLS